MTTPVEWAAAHAPTEVQLRQATDKMLDYHADRWDSFYHFVLFVRDTETDTLALVAVGAIDPAVRPSNYPGAMADVLADACINPRINDPIVAMALMVEGYHTKTDDNGIPDSVREFVHVHTVGVGGGMVSARRYRDGGDVETYIGRTGPEVDPVFVPALLHYTDGLAEMYANGPKFRAFVESRR